MKKSPALFIKEAVSGFFMALADSVPGVSGGTVAFMTGIYDDFIGSSGGSSARTARKENLPFCFFCGSASAGSSVLAFRSPFCPASSQAISTRSTHSSSGWWRRLSPSFSPRKRKR